MTDAASKNERQRRSSGAPHARANAAPQAIHAALPLPDPAQPLAAQAGETLLAMCLFGEARGESPEARRAVAQVVINRARFPHPVFGSASGVSFEENLRRVILAPRQFSCFLESDPNLEKLFHPLEHERAEVWQACVDAAREAVPQADAPDALTLNSDHYFDDSLQPPAWADPSRHTVHLGRLRFFRLYLPLPAAGAGFLLRTGPAESFPPDFAAAESASPRPSRRASLPAEESFRADAMPVRANERRPPARHREEVSASGSPASLPAPHPSSQRTPRLESRDGFNGAGGSPAQRRDSGFAIRAPRSRWRGECWGRNAGAVLREAPRTMPREIPNAMNPSAQTTTHALPATSPAMRAVAPAAGALVGTSAIVLLVELGRSGTLEQYKDLLAPLIGWGPGLLVLIGFLWLANSYAPPFIESQRSTALALQKLADTVEHSSTSQHDLVLAMQVNSDKLEQLRGIVADLQEQVLKHGV